MSFLVIFLDIEGLQLQILSLIKCFASKFQSSMKVIHHKNVRMPNIPKLDALKVNWDDNICKPIHKKCHQKEYQHDIKYHMTLNTIFSVVPYT